MAPSPLTASSAASLRVGRATPVPRDTLSRSQARRVALRAQGLDRGRPERTGPVTMRQFQQVVDRLGLLQIDSVNVLARAHLMPAYSRLGPYDTGLLDRAAGRSPRRLVETWAHEASFVPPETYRMLGWRRRAYRTQAWGSIRDVPLAHAAEVVEIRRLVAEHGPVTASQIQAYFEAEHPRTRTEWGWNWTVAKRVLEYLFFTGEVASARRNAQFERCYDLTERVLPAAVLERPEPSDEEALRALVEIGARAHGIGSTKCLLDYFRLRGPAPARALDELVEDGVLRPVRVEGWARDVYLHRDAIIPRRAEARTLLSPFDPLVFERRRLEELFGLRYRIEIYVPEHKRVHGYYVLPFLLGEDLAALVDLKADRRAGVLRVHSAHRAPGASHASADLAGELAAELRVLAGWLGLADVHVGAVRADSSPAQGDLATALGDALAHGETTGPDRAGLDTAGLETTGLETTA